MHRRAGACILTRMPDRSAEDFPHHVEFRADDGFDRDRLQRIAEWLEEWGFTHEGREIEPGRIVRACFASAKDARTVHRYHGGRLIPADEIEQALDADERDEDRYQDDDAG